LCFAALTVLVTDNGSAPPLPSKNAANTPNFQPLAPAHGGLASHGWPEYGLESTKIYEIYVCAQ
jgi:hypothetical protein